MAGHNNDEIAWRVRAVTGACTCTLTMHHVPARQMRRAAGSVGSLEELAAAAGFQVESAGHLTLLRYVVATR